MIFGIKRKMYNFDPYNVLLAIATNIPVLLMTAFVLQGHTYIYMCYQTINRIQNKRFYFCIFLYMFYTTFFLYNFFFVYLLCIYKYAHIQYIFQKYLHVFTCLYLYSYNLCYK